MDAEQGFQLSEIKGMLQRRLGLVLAIAGTIFLLTVFVSSILENEFESAAMLLIEPQSISERLVESNLADSDLNSRLHLIHIQIMSRGRLSRVIDDLDVYPEESEELTREEVIELMRSKIGVTPVLPQLEAQAGIRNQKLEINTFQLSFRHGSARMAAAVTNRLANDFIEEHLRERVQSSGDTSEFLDAELARLSSRIGEVEARIAQIKGESAGRLPEDLTSNQRLQERLITSIQNTKRDQAMAESDEAFYRQQVLTGVSDFNRFRGEETPERRLEALRIQLGQARSRGFTDRHPDVLAAQAEIEELEANLASTAEGVDDSELSVSQQNAKAEAERAGLRARSSSYEVARLEEQLGEVEARLADTPRVAERLASLEREHDHLFASYQDFSAKRLEAGVAADMERRQKGEKFRVLEQAIPESEPASPNRPVILALGLILGLVVGGSAALLIEASDSSFHDPRVLQERLRLPVLIAVPPVVLESDRLEKRRKLTVQLATAAALTGLVLFASLAGNWIVNGLPGPITELVGSGEAPAEAPVE
jgi:polysaccharide chain length determinant protein (PEP-CTERM system associated)